MFTIAAGIVLGILAVRFMLIRPLLAVGLGGLLLGATLLRAGFALLAGIVLAWLALFWGAFGIELLRMRWQDRERQTPG